MIPHWIQTDGGVRLAIVARPLGDARVVREIAELRGHGVDILVSMLSPREVTGLRLTQEGAACEAVGMAFRSFPIPDHGLPESDAEFRALVESLRAELHAGKSVAAHCFASIGRSSLLLAAILCAEGWPAAKAFARISDARGTEVPDTPEQVRWVEQFAVSFARG
jgi:hypothetical protein